MPKEIFSEGRVVGYSAYETYLKHHIAEFPDIPPASEKQWLASSLASGSSMIVRIPADPYDNEGSIYTVPIPFPDNCRLSAANPIYGSIFLGEIRLDESPYWASEVLQYRGISNTTEYHPVDDEHIPAGDVRFFDREKSMIRSYLKLHDWVITLKRNWEATGSDKPAMDLNPDLTQQPVLLASYSGKLESDVYVLLTGFTNKAVLEGIVDTTGSTDTPRPEDGDFLGPEVYPWAAPVILTLPNESFASDVLVNIGTDGTSAWVENLSNKIQSLSLADIDGQLYDFTGDAGELVKDMERQNDIYSTEFNWEDLKTMLHENKKLQVNLNLAKEGNKYRYFDIGPLLIDMTNSRNSDTETYHGLKVAFRFGPAEPSATAEIDCHIIGWLHDSYGKRQLLAPVNTPSSNYIRCILRITDNLDSSNAVAELKFMVFACQDIILHRESYSTNAYASMMWRPRHRNDGESAPADINKSLFQHEAGVNWQPGSIEQHTCNLGNFSDIGVISDYEFLRGRHLEFQSVNDIAQLVNELGVQTVGYKWGLDLSLMCFASYEDSHYKGESDTMPSDVWSDSAITSLPINGVVTTLYVGDVVGYDNKLYKYCKSVNDRTVPYVWYELQYHWVNLSGKPYDADQLSEAVNPHKFTDWMSICDTSFTFDFNGAQCDPANRLRDDCYVYDHDSAVVDVHEQTNLTATWSKREGDEPFNLGDWYSDDPEVVWNSKATAEFKFTTLTNNVMV